MLALGTPPVVEDLFDRKRGRPRAGEFGKEIEKYAVMGPGPDRFAKHEPTRMGVIDPDFSARVSRCEYDFAGAKSAGYDDGRGQGAFDTEHVLRLGSLVSDGDVEIDVTGRQCLLSEIEASV